MSDPKDKNQNKNSDNRRPLVERKDGTVRVAPADGNPPPPPAEQDSSSSDE